MFHWIRQSLQAKLLVPVIGSAIAVVACCVAYMFYLQRKNTEQTGVASARAIADQIVTLRSFYTAEVATRAKASGMEINYDFARKKSTLPLPATLVNVLGEAIKKDHPGSHIRLYSRYPFPHRKATARYDAFEEAALTALEKDPDKPFYRLETVDGRLSMRYAVGDKMRQACINCHNTHPESPKKDWELGDLRGVVSVTVPVDEAEAGATLIGWIVTVSFLVLAVIIYFLIRRFVIKPVHAFVDTTDRIGRGEFHARVPVNSEDELGNMATAFNGMLEATTALMQSRDERDQIQDSIGKLLEEVSGVAEGDLTKEAEVTADITGAIADSFNHMLEQLRKIISNVQDATIEVSSSASQIRETAEHLAEGSESQAEQIVNTSAAIDEMSVSIQQVSENAGVSASVAQQALTNAKKGNESVQNTIEGMNRIRDQVQETAKRIKRLGESSQEIGQIIQLIDDIADRTSILALNASIQAAMAGEAGRGFAVVAEEVERLAVRSTDATKKIATLVKTIQGETNEAVAAMERSINEVVEGSSLANQAGHALGEIETVSNKLAELIQSISLASKQQARGSEALAKSMNEISQVTQNTAAGTKQAAESVSQLASLADGLRESLDTFRLPGTNGQGTTGRGRDKQHRAGAADKAGAAR